MKTITLIFEDTTAFAAFKAWVDHDTSQGSPSPLKSAIAQSYAHKAKQSWADVKPDASDLVEAMATVGKMDLATALYEVKDHLSNKEIEEAVLQLDIDPAEVGELLLAIHHGER